MAMLHHLLDKNADVAALDSMGSPALHHAVMMRHKKVPIHTSLSEYLDPKRIAGNKASFWVGAIALGTATDARHKSNIFNDCFGGRRHSNST